MTREEELRKIRVHCENTLILRASAKNNKNASYNGSSRVNMAAGVLQVLDQIEHKRRMRERRTDEEDRG
jgi:hypothetical protein